MRHQADAVPPALGDQARPSAPAASVPLARTAYPLEGLEVVQPLVARVDTPPPQPGAGWPTSWSGGRWCRSLGRPMQEDPAPLDRHPGPGLRPCALGGGRARCGWSGRRRPRTPGGWCCSRGRRRPGPGRAGSAAPGVPRRRPSARPGGGSGDATPRISSSEGLDARAFKPWSRPARPRRFGAPSRRKRRDGRACRIIPSGGGVQERAGHDRPAAATTHRPGAPRRCAAAVAVDQVGRPSRRRGDSARICASRQDFSKGRRRDRHRARRWAGAQAAPLHRLAAQALVPVDGDTTILDIALRNSPPSSCVTWPSSWATPPRRSRSGASLEPVRRELDAGLQRQGRGLEQRLLAVVRRDHMSDGVSSSTGTPSTRSPSRRRSWPPAAPASCSPSTPRSGSWRRR